MCRPSLCCPGPQNRPVPSRGPRNASADFRGCIHWLFCHSVKKLNLMGSSAVLWLRAVLAAALSAAAHGHSPQPTAAAPLCNASTPPVIGSWHIHVMFWPDGPEGTNNGPKGSIKALALRSRFIHAFNLTETPNCTALIDPSNQLCSFEVGWSPGFGFSRPFVAPNFAFFVPVSRFADTVPWLMQHRGGLDVLVHPNTGCPVNDHRDWASWMGNMWELKMNF